MAGDVSPREAIAKIIGDGIYGPSRQHIYRHNTLPLADAIVARFERQCVAEVEAEIRSSIRKVFDLHLQWMAKAVTQGSFPMDADGKFVSWSDWLSNKVIAALTESRP